jgi:drug/metabolite transporter (DMT)-like permease
MINKLKKPGNRTVIAYMELLFASFGWAMSTIIIKKYVGDIPPFHLLTGRFFVAALFLFLIRPKHYKKTDISTVKTGVLLGFFSFLAYALAMVGLVYTTASKAGFFVAMAVMFVPTFECVLKRKRPSKWLLISIFMALVGLYLVSGMNGLGINKGDLLSIGCALAYTIYILFLDRMGDNKDSLILTEVQLVFVVLLGIISMILFEGISIKYFLAAIGPVLVLGIIGTGLTTLLQARGQKYASPESVGLIFLGEPLFTFVMAVVLLNEVVNLSGIIGAVLLLLAMIVTVLKKV